MKRLASSLAVVGCLVVAVFVGATDFRYSAVDCLIGTSLKGRVCIGPRTEWCYPLDGVKVSIWDKVRDGDIPADFTNHDGEFVVDDQISFGYTVEVPRTDKSSGFIDFSKYRVVEGTTAIELLLKFEKEGFYDELFNLAPLDQGGWIESATPIEIWMTPYEIDDATSDEHPCTKENR